MLDRFSSLRDNKLPRFDELLSYCCGTNEIRNYTFEKSQANYCAYRRCRSFLQTNYSFILCIRGVSVTKADSDDFQLVVRVLRIPLRNLTDLFTPYRYACMASVLCTPITVEPDVPFTISQGACLVSSLCWHVFSSFVQEVWFVFRCGCHQNSEFALRCIDYRVQRSSFLVQYNATYSSCGYIFFLIPILLFSSTGLIGWRIFA